MWLVTISVRGVGSRFSDRSRNFHGAAGARKKRRGEKTASGAADDGDLTSDPRPLSISCCRVTFPRRKSESLPTRRIKAAVLCKANFSFRQKWTAGCPQS